MHHVAQPRAPRRAHGAAPARGRPVGGAAGLRSGLSYAALETIDGSFTLVHPGHGEAFHSRSGAWLEARERYAVPCRLAERAAALGRPLELLDLGTGPGWNLAAALAAVAGVGGTLAVDTFELDPAVLRAAFELPSAPRDAAPWFDRVRATLARGLAAPGTRTPIEGGGGELALWLGDARGELPRACGGPYDAVFLDAFSPAREGAGTGLWEPAFLGAVARRMRPEALLSTFTCAFSVRASLAAAGLEVGAGPAVGAKRSGTLASPAMALPPLRPSVAARLSGVPEGPGGEKRGPRA